MRDVTEQFLSVCQVFTSIIEVVYVCECVHTECVTGRHHHHQQQQHHQHHQHHRQRPQLQELDSDPDDSLYTL